MERASIALLSFGVKFSGQSTIRKLRRLHYFACPMFPLLLALSLNMLN